MGLNCSGTQAGGSWMDFRLEYWATTEQVARASGPGYGDLGVSGLWGNA